ncbi:MAG TPA: hypothetical protein VGR00_15420, partial [Thermoanaerobaculia bacterium]|nr:hypothetical protein [Thermoanaerobaculia bacterium]
HYYVGAKYFPELRYTRLYDATVVARLERGGSALPRWFRYRNLATNQIEDTSRVKGAAEAVVSRFSPERWEEFVHDMAFFTSHENRWVEILHDHGYNATPVWGLAGSLFANSGPASEGQILFLTLLDPLLLLAMFAIVGLGFGWRAAAVGMVFLGTNDFARLSWTGGAYLRMDWLAFTVLGVAFLALKRPVLSGFLFSYAALLRLFPAVVLLGLVTKLLVDSARKKRFDLTRERWRLFGGALVGGAALLLLSVASFGPRVWPEFVQNIEKHASTPLTNHVGAKSLLSYAAESRAEATRNPVLADPYEPWKEARHRVFSRRAPLFALVCLAFFAAFAAAAWREREDWVTATLALALVPVFFELTCYYEIALIGLALLAPRRPWIGPALAAVAAFSCWAHFHFAWDDDRYAALSLVLLLFSAGVLVSAIVRPMGKSEPIAAS